MSHVIQPFYLSHIYFSSSVLGNWSLMELKSNVRVSFLCQIRNHLSHLTPNSFPWIQVCNFFFFFFLLWSYTYCCGISAHKERGGKPASPSLGPFRLFPADIILTNGSLAWDFRILSYFSLVCPLRFAFSLSGACSVDRK